MAHRGMILQLFLVAAAKSTALVITFKLGIMQSDVRNSNALYDMFKCYLLCLLAWTTEGRLHDLS